MPRFAITPDKLELYSDEEAQLAALNVIWERLYSEVSSRSAQFDQEGERERWTDEA